MEVLMMKTNPNSKTPWTEAEIADAWLPMDDPSLGYNNAHHLLRRAGFGGTVAEIKQLSRLDSHEAIDQLMHPADAASFDKEADSIIQARLVLGESQQVIDWWLYRMRFDPFALREKATWMWHSHFCTSRTKVTDARLLWQQNQTLRSNSLGSFADLVKLISRDPAMLI